METKKRMQRFLSIFLACIMILNVPMSALAYEDVMILDAVEDLEVYAEQEEAISGETVIAEEIVDAEENPTHTEDELNEDFSESQTKISEEDAIYVENSSEFVECIEVFNEEVMDETALDLAVEALSDADETQYLSHLYIKKDNKDTQTDLIQSGKYEYEYPVPANLTSVYVKVRTSEDAPNGTVAAINYLKDGTEAKTWQVNLSSTAMQYPVSFASGMTKGWMEVVVGVEGNQQTYTVYFPKTIALGEAEFALSGDAELIFVNDVYYLPQGYEGEVALSVDGYGAGLTVRGNGNEIQAEEAENSGSSQQTYKFKPVFDENSNTYEVVVDAVYGEGETKQSATKSYQIRQLSDTTPVTGTCGSTGQESSVSWSYLNKTLTLSGTGKTMDWNVKKRPDWEKFLEEGTAVIVQAGVSGLGNNAFLRNSKITSVELSDTLISIGLGCFKGCAGLTSVTIPKTVTQIGSNAFFECSNLKSVSTGNASGAAMFSQCSNLESVVLAEGITSIGQSAFNSCSALKNITIPDTVTEVGKYAFANSGLETVTTGILSNYIFDSCRSLKTINLGETVTAIPAYAFKDCTALETLDLTDSKVTELADYAFSGCTGLKRVTLPSGMSNVNAAAFSGCTALTEITIDGGQYLFEDGIVYSSDKKKVIFCPNGKSGIVQLPAETEVIGANAFFGCTGLTEIQFPEGLTTIESSAFNGCTGLQELKLPDSVCTIGADAFSGCSALEKIHLSENISAIADRTFFRCEKLSEIEFPKGITAIGDRAFLYCSNLSKIILPDSVETIGNSAFACCTAMTEFTVPEHVTELSSGLLEGNSKLEKLVLPAGLKNIASGALSSTNSLKYVLFAGTIQQWNAITGNKPETPSWKNAVLLCNSKSIGNEEDAPTWKSMPVSQNFAIGEDASGALQAEADAPEDGSSISFIWYQNTKKEISGTRVTSGSFSSQLRSFYTPSTAEKGVTYYYCMAVKVDSEGAASWSYSDIVSVAVGMNDFPGKGTASQPYELDSQEDMEHLRSLVAAGQTMENTYFKLTADITLPENWKPIGTKKNADIDSIQSGKNLNAFSGILDGNDHTVNVPEGGLPLFGYVKGAEIRNLKIYGPKIVGYGLINNLEGVGLSGRAVLIENVTLVKGTQTLKSGFLGANITENGFAGCSAGFYAVIRNCTIEEGVVIGYDKKERKIGSFAGGLNGTIENCVSHAAVYGTSYVGGILGSRDNATAECVVKGCTFDGTVEATGIMVGGIVGGGYGINDTAPNASLPIILNCNASGNIVGKNSVGGILGGDPYVEQLWGTCSLKGNTFTGTVKATETENVCLGGIIGSLSGMNKYNDISNNYYSADCGAEKGIGFIRHIDTDARAFGTGEDGVIYYNTSKDSLDEINKLVDLKPDDGYSPLVKTGLNRTDDPLGADAGKLTNTTGVQKYVEKLEISGDYKTTYYMGQKFSMDGMIFTATWSDESVTHPSAEEITVEGFDSSKRDTQIVTLHYGAASAALTVKVLKSIEVTFSLFGDKIHNSETDGHVHTLSAGNLETWVPETIYYMDPNATVYQVLLEAAEQYGFTLIGDSNNAYGSMYVRGITWKYMDGTKVTIKELTNGSKSGWMNTVNGVHPTVGIAQQYLNDGDTIVFHYTDDYTKEEDSARDKEMADKTIQLINAIPELDKLTLADRKVVWEARDAYADLNETQIALVGTDILRKLEAAEARIAELEKNAHVHSWDAGTVTKAATCTATGVKTFKCGCGESKTETIPALGHKFGAWTTVSEATVKAAEVQKHTCSVCGASETQNVGSKLTAVLQIPGKISSFNMKKGKTESFKVTMANGDSVTSVKSSKTKVLKATLDQKTGKITLKALKTGTAKLTITLDSKTSKNYTVKVVTGTVKTTGVSVISVANKKLTLEKGKTHTLKTEVKPFTTTQKLTYKSSNKKVATVTSKGKIEAVAPGKATITVKSGSQSVKITVTVPGITIAKSSVTVKKNKTTTLKPNAYGISGKVTYTSSNPKVATVTSKGKVKGIKKGTAKITIQAGTFKKTVTIKVK